MNAQIVHPASPVGASPHVRGDRSHRGGHRASRKRPCATGPLVLRLARLQSSAHCCRAARLFSSRDGSQSCPLAGISSAPGGHSHRWMERVSARRLPARCSRDERPRFLPASSQTLGARPRFLPDGLRRDERRARARRAFCRAEYRPLRFHLPAFGDRRCEADRAARRSSSAARGRQAQSRRKSRRTTCGPMAIGRSASREKCWPSSRLGP